MPKRIGLLLICFMLVTSSIVVFSFENVKAAGTTLYVGGNGPGNYSCIQDAIDDATNGDTIFVFNGTYYENIVVNKSINLIGENRDTTFIHGKRIGIVVNITAHSVLIRDFTITKGICGVYSVGGASNITIASCICFENNDPGGWRGQICLSDTKNCIVNDNIVFSSNNRGVVFESGGNNTVYSNIIYYNRCYGGIDIINSDNNVIYDNIAYWNRWGISINGGSDNIIFNNTIYENDCGVNIDWPCSSNIVLNNSINSNKVGVSVGGHKNSYNIISNNFIFNNYNGIEIRYLGHTIENNTIIENSNSGVAVFNASNNNVLNNIIINNTLGIGLSKSSDNIIQGNNILNNAIGVSLIPLSNRNVISYNNIFRNKFFGIIGVLSFSNNARHNWWGSMSGPKLLFIGSGDRILWILGRISFFPWSLESINGNAF